MVLGLRHIISYLIKINSPISLKKLIKSGKIVGKFKIYPNTASTAKVCVGIFAELSSA